MEMGSQWKYSGLKSVEVYIEAMEDNGSRSKSMWKLVDVYMEARESHLDVNGSRGISV